MIINKLRIALIIFFSFFICSSLTAQLTITGTILDENATPLIGVNIIENDTQNGTISDIDGRFILSALSDTVDLTFSYIGYANYSLKDITEARDFKITMEQSILTPGCGVVIIEPNVQYPQNYAHLKSAELLHNPVSNLSEPFNTIPGVTYQSGTLGTNRLTIRGIGSRNQFGTAKILGYWNGIQITNTRGELAIEDLNLDFMDRVEVMRGPTSPQYGSGLGGVVHMHTENRRYNGLDSRVTFGSYNQVSHSHRAHFSGLSNRLQASLGYANLTTDGFRINNNYQRQNLNGHMTFTAGKLSNVLVSAFFYKTQVLGQIPSSLNAETFELDPSQAASNWAAVAGFEDFETDRIGLSVQYSTKSNWHFKAAYSKYQTVNDELRPFNTLFEESTGTSTRFTATKEELFLSNLKLETGVEFISESRDWNTSRDSITLDDFKDEGTNWMQFVNFRYRLGRGYELNLGASAAQHSYQLYAETDSSKIDNGLNDYINFSPSLKLSRSDKYNTLQYISIAHGFSPPNSDEILNSDQTVNTDIQPETGWTFEVGAKNYRNQLQYDITAYYMPTANLLVPRRISEEITIGVNAGSTRHFGVELGLNYVDWRTGDVDHNLSGMIAYSINRFTDFELDGEQFSDNDVTGIPPITAAAKWVSEYKGFTARLDGQYRSSLPINDSNTVYSDDYTLVNGSLGYQYQLEKQHNLIVSAKANVNNILDTNYASMVLVNANSFGGNPPRYYYPGMPRNYAITVGVSLELK